MSSIGNLIRSKRTEKGVSLSGLGNHLGYTPQFISNWERGVSNPPLEKIRPICEYIGISIKEAKEALINDYKERLKSL